jgi:anhydro-N-acetylmuramic acid kinase
LLAQWLAEPYLSRPAPKSTGRDLFHLAWLESVSGSRLPALAPVDVQATLCELTARSIADDLSRVAPDAIELLVCGGGAYNGLLLARLQASLSPLPVRSTDQAGLPPLQVEAAAFAWLARQHLNGQPGNAPAVTGARGPRILGAFHPA